MNKAPRVWATAARHVLVFVTACQLCGPVVAQKPDAERLEPVTLHLKWMHAYQFAGYYAAKEEGFYRQEGLDVTINAASADLQAIDAVLMGSAEYGVWGSEVLNERLAGKPFVVLAVIFQHSPYIVLSRREENIRVPSDLVGHTIMADSKQGSTLLAAMLTHEGLSPDDVVLVPHTWNIDDILSERVDATMAYVTDQPNRMSISGVEPSIIRPVDYGIDFYGDCLFTTESEIEEHPKRVEAFRRASLKGWEYAMTHVDEMVRIILEMPDVRQRGLTAQHLRYEAEQMQDLILPNLVEIGHTNPGRWKHIADTYVSLGLLEPDYSLEGFTYTPEPPPDYRWIYSLLGVIVGIAVVGALAWIWNRQLRGAVRVRTKELRESQQRLQTVIQTMPVLVDAFDTKQNIIVWNSECERVSGYTADEIVGNPDALCMLYPDPEYRQWMMTNIDNEGDFRNLEFNLTCKNGETRTVLWSNLSISHPISGWAIWAVGIDITERKEAEEQLEIQNAELERFTYTVSHDLKSPLITINGYIGVLREELADLEMESANDALTRITNAACKMGSLLDDLLELSRIGRMANPPEDMPLEELAQEAVALLHGPLTQEKIEVDIRPGLPLIRGDRLRLFEVIQNLIENAVKYMGDQPRPRIEIGTRRDGNETVCYVQDNGIGIDPRYHKKVFGLFDQLDPRAEGTGIGLALAKRIVEFHGGRIWIESEGRQSGSTFCFTIPQLARDGTP